MKGWRLFRNIAAVALALAVWAPWAVFAAEGQKGEGQKSDKPPANAAVVNGKAIPYADFQRELQMFKRRVQEQGGQLPAGVQASTEVVNDLIARELIFQESVKKGVKVDPKAVTEEVAGIQARFPDKPQFESWLATMGLNEEKLKQQIAQHKAIRSFIDAEIAPKVKVNEEEARDFYSKNPALFQRPEEVHAQHILIKVEKNAAEAQKTEARKKLQALKKRIAAGEDFGELAKSNSQCPSAPNKGDLGFFGKGRMVPSFEKAAFEAKPGQVSDVVETQFGYHLIKVLERRPAESMKYEDVQSRITADLRNRQVYAEVRKFAEQLRKAAKVETFVH